MDVKMKTMAVALVAVLLATPGFGAPTIAHEPIPVAVKGQPLGVRATVRDAGARVEAVSLFYASSRGMTPFRAAMSSSGAGIWYATVPGHMIGPGSQLFYYLQAENADGETAETDWQTVKVVESGVAPAAIPAASDVARQAQRAAEPTKTETPSPVPPAAGKANKSKYLVPMAVIAGGAVAIGGAIAIADDNSGGGGGGSGTVTNGNFGGNFDYSFVPSSPTNGASARAQGLANVYVDGSAVEIVGLWGPEVFRTTSNGQTFTVSTAVSAYADFPPSYLFLSGEFEDDVCTVRVDGYSTDAARAGTYAGQLVATRR